MATAALAVGIGAAPAHGSAPPADTDDVPSSTNGDEPPTLLFAAQPRGEPLDSIPLEIAADETSASALVFVSEQGGRAIDDVIVFAGTRPGTADLEFRRGDAEAGPTATFSLSEGGVTDLQIVVTWDGWGSVEIPLLASIDDTVTALPSVLLTRPGGPPLVVDQAVDGALSLASSGERLDTAIAVTSGARPVERLEATLSPIVDPTTGEVIPLEPVPPIGDVAPHERVLIPLRADLPVDGEYTTTLRLSHDGVVDDPVVVTISRGLVAAHVTVDASATLAADFGTFGSVEFTRVVSLNETSGRPAIVARPLLVAPTTGTGTTTVEGRIRVVDATVDPADQSECRAGPAGAIELDPRASCRVAVRFEVSDPPGQFDGTLRFLVASSSPVDTKVVVQLRRNVWVAAGVIAVGLLFGFVVQTGLRDRRTRLLLELDIARVTEQFELRRATIPKPRDGWERTLVADVAAVLNNIALEPAVSDAERTAVRARLEAFSLVAGQLGPLIELRRDIVALDRPEVVRDLLRQLEPLRANAVDPTTDKDRAAELKSGIEALIERLETLRVDQLVADIEVTITQVHTLVKEPARSQLTAWLTTLKGDAAKAPGATANELRKAQGELQRHARYEMERFLDRSASEIGLDDEVEWSRLAREIRTQLRGVEAAAPEEVNRRLRDADHRLLDGMIRLIERERAALERIADGSRSDEQQARLSRLVAAQPDLTSASGGLDKGDHVAARAALQRAIDSLRAPVVDAAPHTNLIRPEHAPAHPPAIPHVAAPTYRPVEAQAGTSALPTMLATSRKLSKLNYLAAFITVVLGTALGVTALWAGDATWGGPVDLLTAVLWGAGVAQVSNVVNGFGGVRTTLEPEAR